MLNHAQVGRFTREGFATWNLRPPRHGSLVPCPIDIPLGRAVAASAAFPFGLAPLKIRMSRLSDADPRDELKGAKTLHLTDGGVASATYPCFGACSWQQLDALDRHARWQVYAGAAIDGSLGR